MGGQINISKSGKQLSPKQQYIANKRLNVRMNRAGKSPIVAVEKPKDNPEQQKIPKFTEIPTSDLRPGFEGQAWLNQNIDLMDKINGAGANNQDNQAIIPSLNSTKLNTKNRGAGLSAYVRENLLQNNRGAQQSAQTQKNRLRNTRGGQQSAQTNNKTQQNYPGALPPQRSTNLYNNIPASARGGDKLPEFERYSKQPVGSGKGTVPKTKPLYKNELMTALLKIGLRKTDENFTEADKRQVMIDILTKQAMVKFIGTNANDAK